MASTVSSVLCGPNLSLIIFPALGLISQAAQAVLHAALRPPKPLCASLTTMEAIASGGGSLAGIPSLFPPRIE
jgi:hypothetical protein